VPGGKESKRVSESPVGVRRQLLGTLGLGKRWVGGCRLVACDDCGG
jgi:hypothetical protein